MKINKISGLLSASSNLLSVFSDFEQKKVFVLSLDFLDHVESRVRSSSAALLADLVVILGEAQFFVAFGRILDLIKRDLARDPGQADLPQNEVVRQKILEGQKVRGLSSQERMKIYLRFSQIFSQFLYFHKISQSTFFTICDFFSIIHYF